jgi:hypothetical protein
MSDNDGDAPYDAATVAFIYAHTKGTPERQVQGLDSLDAKATQLFTVASLIVGFAGLGGLAVHPPLASVALVLSGLFVYLVAAVIALTVVRPVTVARSEHGDTLWEDYRRSPVIDIQQRLVEEMPGLVKINEAIMKTKAQRLRFLTRALALEAACVVSGVAVAVLAK